MTQVKGKKVYLGTNTKMYKGVADTASYLEELCRLTGDLSREKKDSFYWYKKVIASNGEDLS